MGGTTHLCRSSHVGGNGEAGPLSQIFDFVMDSSRHRLVERLVVATRAGWARLPMSCTHWKRPVRPRASLMTERGISPKWTRRRSYRTSRLVIRKPPFDLTSRLCVPSLGIAVCSAVVDRVAAAAPKACPLRPTERLNWRMGLSRRGPHVQPESPISEKSRPDQQRRTGRGLFRSGLAALR